MAPVTKFTTEMYSYVTSFCICMNERSLKALPANLRGLIEKSFVGVEKEVGHEWDKLDDLGKAIMVKAGDQPIELSKEEAAKFRAIGEKVAETRVAELEAKGLPAKEVYALMKKLSAKHEKTSRNFWKY